MNPDDFLVLSDVPIAHCRTYSFIQPGGKVVHHRRMWHNGEETPVMTDPDHPSLKYWVEEHALPLLAEKIEAGEKGPFTIREFNHELKAVIDPSKWGLVENEYQGQVITLNDGRNNLVAVAVAGILPVQEQPPFRNKIRNTDERIIRCAGVDYQWGAETPIPAPGDKVMVTVNDIGPGTVVGYQASTQLAYYGGFDLLNLLVRMDSPPEWWVTTNYHAHTLATANPLPFAEWKRRGMVGCVWGEGVSLQVAATV